METSIKSSQKTVPNEIIELLLDPVAYADERVLGALSWLRTNAPFATIEAPGFEPFRIITRHADIMEISRQNKIFRAGDKSLILIDKVGNDHVLSINNNDPNFIDTLANMDAPRHMGFRLLTQSWFMPSNLKKLEDHIRVIARDAIDKMIASGDRCDFANDVAFTYPLHVVMSILGVPEEDEHLMHRLTQELFGVQDPDIADKGEALQAEDYIKSQIETFASFERYFNVLADDRRANPKSDLATVIANAKINGEPLNQREQSGYFIVIATAGHDTTAISSAAAVEQLASDPHLFSMIKQDRSLIPGLIDEAIRWATPIKHFMRTAIEDTECRGEHFKANEWIMMSYLSGNRDETVFDDPNSFRVDRRLNKNLSFGYGVHMCLGQHLAKLEMRILFEEMFSRIASIELDGPVARTKSWFQSGIRSLPIRYCLD
jgi:cytochrome P450